MRTFIDGVEQPRERRSTRIGVIGDYVPLSIREEFAPLGTTVQCDECGKTSLIDDWREAEVSCDDCGNHPALACPKCDERYDAVYESQRSRVSRVSA